jgi:hypothetical protein
VQQNLWRGFLNQKVAVQFKKPIILCYAGENRQQETIPGPLEVPGPDGAVPAMVSLLFDATLIALDDESCVLEWHGVGSGSAAYDGAEFEIAARLDAISCMWRVSKEPSSLVLPAS